ncbi:hypothetical protein S7335_604 [Synechococcus sp. PCC 7335]|nr:hypothetical protein S7335_604 [Synechococcus sp. PCC 7335]
MIAPAVALIYSSLQQPTTVARKALNPLAFSPLEIASAASLMHLNATVQLLALSKEGLCL